MADVLTMPLIQQALHTSRALSTVLSASKAKSNGPSALFLPTTPANTQYACRELQDATPELAARLKARQESAARTQRLLSEEEEAAAAASSSEPPGWSNTAAPFGGQLAALLRKR